MQQTLHDVLGIHGHQALVVGSAEEALRLLHRVDLVLVDGMLPGRDGWDLCREIKRLHGDALPVIIVTARAESDAITRTFEAGADDYVAKPFRAVELLARVETRIRVRRAEDQLRASEQRYRVFFEEDFSGGYVCDADGVILDCNAAFADIFGYPAPADAVGENLDAQFPEGEFAPFLSLLREQRRLKRTEFELRCLDGDPVHVIQNVIGTFSEEGELTGFKGYMVDITERKALQERLIQSQRLEAVGRLAGGIAHDFNNLLTVIRGNTSLLLFDTPEDAPARTELEEIEEAATRAAELTSQLLAFSRRQPLQPAVLSLNGVIAEMERPLRRLLGNEIRLVTRLARDLEPVEVDPVQLRQVLRSLATNARDAMPEGGTLTIETASQPLPEGEGGPTRLRPGRYAVVTVRDTGLGMSPEVRARAFEPFFTTKEVGKGTGLGLSSAYGIVEQSGGSIRFSSEQGEGTTFRIYFPVARDGEAKGR